MIILHFHLQPQFKYELFHIYFTWLTMFETTWSLYEIIHIWTAVVDESDGWSFFTFIYNRSSNMNYFIYTSHHFTPHRKIWPQLIDLAPNVWLHSSAGRASHWCSQRSQVRIPLKPWFFQASSFQLLKLENLLRWSFFTFTINIINHVDLIRESRHNTCTALLVRGSIANTGIHVILIICLA